MPRNNRYNVALQRRKVWDSQLNGWRPARWSEMTDEERFAEADKQIQQNKRMIARLKR